MTLIVEPRTVLVVDDSVWWVPRLDQLLERLEWVARRWWPELPDGQVRERIAQQLAEKLGETGLSWEEAVLDMLLTTIRSPGA